MQTVDEMVGLGEGTQQVEHWAHVWRNSVMFQNTVQGVFMWGRGSSFLKWPHCLFSHILGSRCDYYLHSLDEQTKTMGCQETCPTASFGIEEVGRRGQICYDDQSDPRARALSPDSSSFL